MILGVRYESTIESTDINIGDFAHSGKTRTTGADTYFINTLGGVISYDGGATVRSVDVDLDETEQFAFIGTDGVGVTYSLFSGMVHVPFGSRHQDQQGLFYQTDTHWPATLTAFGLHTERYE